MDSNLLKTYVRVKRIPKGQRSAFKKLVERLLESAARKRNAIAICDEAHEVLFKKKLSVDAAEYGLIRCDSP